MPLSNLPGPWRWEQRDGSWWRIHDGQNIQDGPHDAPHPQKCSGSGKLPDRVESVRGIVRCRVCGEWFGEDGGGSDVLRDHAEHVSSA